MTEMLVLQNKQNAQTTWLSNYEIQQKSSLQ